MNILRFFRRTKSHYVDDRAVDDFELVLTEQQRTDELAALIGKDDPAPADVGRIGKLLNG